MNEATRFQLRVADNALAIVGREMARRGPAEAAETTSLLALLGDAPATADLAALNRLLVARIQDGAFDAPDSSRALRAHLAATTAAKLAIDNPRYK